MVKQLKWREPAGTHRMLSGECATAGFLFLQLDRNPSAFQQCPNIVGSKP
jgi:hypothetical protein